MHRDAWTGSRLATVPDRCFLDHYLYGPSDELRALRRLGSVAWCALPQTLRAQAATALTHQYPPAPDVWPRDKEFQLWGTGYIHDEYARNPEMRRLMTQPDYRPDWFWFLHQRLSEMGEGWFDRRFLLEWHGKDGCHHNGWLPLHREAEAADWPARDYYGRWRVHYLNVDPFTA
jgi:hypothetical protein